MRGARDDARQRVWVCWSNGILVGWTSLDGRVVGKVAVEEGCTLARFFVLSFCD